MQVKDLIKITLDELGTKHLLSLPAPENCGLAVNDANEAFGLQSHFYNLWRQLILQNANVSVDEYIWECELGHQHVLKGTSLKGRLFLAISAYFEFALEIFLSKEKIPGKHPSLPQCFVLDSISSFRPAESTQNSDSSLIRLQIASYDYFTARFCLYFIKLFSNIELELPPIRTIEKVYHESVSTLHSTLLRLSHNDEKIAVNRLLNKLLSIAAETYANFDKWKTEHKPAIFSAIRLDQLSGLASRNEALCARYGDKHIEKIFERQLSFILQSFGLYVVSTETGQSTIDLLCISASPLDQFTFLVEAKTSKEPYSLPKKDSRAIQDYVEDVKRSLPSLPPLAFVLIVGQAWAKSLPNKIQQLEAEAGMVVRYMDASNFARLREQIPGPLPLKIFLNSVLKSDPILSDEFIANIVNGSLAEQTAHQAFVKSMFSARGVIRSSATQWVENTHATPPLLDHSTKGRKSKDKKQQ